jgi:hypothetical protein
MTFEFLGLPMLGIGIMGKSIDDVAEVAVDASGGLTGVDLAIVENSALVISYLVLRNE